MLSYSQRSFPVFSCSVSGEFVTFQRVTLPPAINRSGHVEFFTRDPLRGRGVYFGFKMIEWRQKSKPHKSLGLPTKTIKKSLDQKLPPINSHAESPSLKNFQKWLQVHSVFAEIRSRDARALPRGTTTNLHIVLNTPKKKPEIKKGKSFEYSRHLNPEYSTPPSTRDPLLSGTLKTGRRITSMSGISL